MILPVNVSACMLLLSCILLTSQSGQAQDELLVRANQRNLNHAPWNPADMDELRRETGLIGPGPRARIPDAKFPDYLKKPGTIEEMMPQARAAVTQKGGRSPLGLAEPGDVVLVIVPYNADPLIQKAIGQAFNARNIKVHILYENDMVGVSREGMETLTRIKNVFKSGDGQQESARMFEELGAWPDFNVYKNWVKQKDPVYYAATWPEIAYPNEALEKLDKSYDSAVFAAVIEFLDEHPEINHIFFRNGSRTLTKSSLKHHGDKFMGNYTYLNHYDLMSQVPNLPADVWRMLEGKIIDPLAFVDRYEATDPEGTAIYGEITAAEAKIWADGSYQQGHLYMLPSQAGGRYPYSRINYPATGNNWLEPLQGRTTGVIASTNSHASNHARIEVHVKDGYIEKVMGGGLFGDGMRISMQYPKINEMTWPFHKKPGFWWLFESGLATNPKYFKHPGEILQGDNFSERNVGGVIHWSFGVEIKHGPEQGNVGMSPASLEFAREHQLPVGHGMHHHSLLPTYQVRLRDSGNWLTLIEHGLIQTYNDPEVRALASRYGNPDEMLQRDWIPELPGITSAGDYNSDYASDPGSFWINWANKMLNNSN